MRCEIVPETHIPPFAPKVRSSMRVKQREKRHFVDPSLPCAILGMTKDKLIEDLEYLGFLFESMVERDLLTYVDSFDAKLFPLSRLQEQRDRCGDRTGRWSMVRHRDQARGPPDRRGSQKSRSNQRKDQKGRGKAGKGAVCPLRPFQRRLPETGWRLCRSDHFLEELIFGKGIGPEPRTGSAKC